MSAPADCMLEFMVHTHSHKSDACLGQVLIMVDTGRPDRTVIWKADPPLDGLAPTPKAQSVGIVRPGQSRLESDVLITLCVSCQGDIGTCVRWLPRY